MTDTDTRPLTVAEFRKALEAMRPPKGMVVRHAFAEAALATLPPPAAECAGFVCSGVNIDGYSVGYSHTNHDGVSTCSGECRCKCGAPWSAHQPPAPKPVEPPAPATALPPKKVRNRVVVHAPHVNEGCASADRALSLWAHDYDALHAAATALVAERDELATACRHWEAVNAGTQAENARLRERLSRLNSPIQDERNSEE